MASALNFCMGALVSTLQHFEFCWRQSHRDFFILADSASPRAKTHSPSVEELGLTLDSEACTLFPQHQRLLLSSDFPFPFMVFVIWRDYANGWNLTHTASHFPPFHCILWLYSVVAHFATSGGSPHLPKNCVYSIVRTILQQTTYNLRRRIHLWDGWTLQTRISIPCMKTELQSLL